ncbi:hypothetical protein ACH4T9_11560 [Micromonospora sp. NPDC020750]|uniref:hypothetical protein n=1 Tax=unclassified Micromonospora TaxID=2617518 RepID=UPI0037B4BDC5
MTRVRRDGGARDATPTCPPAVPVAAGRVLARAPLARAPLARGLVVAGVAG